MVRFKVVVALTGAILLLLAFLAVAQPSDSRPWDEPVKCPKCKSDYVVYILYGEPNLDEDLKRAIGTHKVELGGCILTPDSQRWECRSCGHSWGRVASGAGNPP